PSSAPTAEGADQVRVAYEFVFANIQLAIKFSIDEIEIRDDLAFARTGSKGTVKILANGTLAPEENREFFLFEKQDGEWKIARYIFNKVS
ncbi:MAG: nuclear transport factor 2 family protein, partial [Gemmatimonadales bacterium]